MTATRSSRVKQIAVMLTSLMAGFVGGHFARCRTFLTGNENLVTQMFVPASNL